MALMPERYNKRPQSPAFVAMREALKALIEDAEKAVNPASRLFNYAQVKAAIKLEESETQ